MPRFFLIALFGLLPYLLQAQIPERGEIISHTLIKHYTFAEIQAEYAAIGLPTFVAPIDYEIDVYKVVYWTLNPMGTGLTHASGAAFIPLNYPCGAPMMIYNHGTTLYDSGVPSNLGGEVQIGIPFTATGYLLCMPDYLGLGEGPGRHPFVHAKSEATCGVDMLRATRNLCDTLGVALNDQIFVTGYSQGGHVAMATHKELQTEHAGEFTVTASAPCSGPYDVSGITRDSLLAPRPSATASLYLSYVVLGYQEAYGNLYNDLSEVFVPPYDTEIPLIFNRSGPLTNTQLPDTAITMFQPALLQQILTDSLHPFNVALRENDLYDWVPQAPMRMFYCEADEQVTYVNSTFTEAQMQANGAPNVEAISVGETLDHNGCAFPAILQTKLFFDSRLEDCSTAIDPNQAISLQVAPNPFREQLDIRWDGQLAHIHSVELLDLQGKMLRSAQPLSNGQARISGNGLPAGVYILALKGEQQYYRKVVIE